MAKKRKNKGGSPPASPPAATETPAAAEATDRADGAGPAAVEPLGSVWERFWTRPFLETRLAMFRLFFFGCVAFESFLDLEHAPRYGAGGFNVPHFDLLESLPVPSRYAMVVLFLVQFALALRVAVGLGGRVTVWALTAVYGYTYFISQLDSYQHHYMVFLFLVLMSLVDWESEKPRAWPIHLTVVQTCIVYFWAGVTKAHPLWIDGTLLRQQVGGGALGSYVRDSGVSEDTAFTLLANYAMGMEFAVPFMILWAGTLPTGSRLREGLGWAATFIGLPLHFGIEWAGLEIGLFSYMMMAFYLLVVPDRFYGWIDALVAMVWTPPSDETRATLARLGTPALAVAVAFTGWTIWQLPLEYTGAAAAVVSAVALASEWPLRSGRFARALGHGLVGLTVLYAASSGTTLRQYWYYLGGDARRRGDLALAIYGYDNTTAVEPTYGSAYVRLSQMYQASSRLDDARTAVERGLDQATPTYDLYEQLAVVCDALGDRRCAGDAARKALGFKQDARMRGLAMKHPPQ